MVEKVLRREGVYGEGGQRWLRHGVLSLLHLLRKQNVGGMAMQRRRRRRGGDGGKLKGGEVVSRGTHDHHVVLIREQTASVWNIVNLREIKKLEKMKMNVAWLAGGAKSLVCWGSN